MPVPDGRNPLLLIRKAARLARAAFFLSLAACAAPAAAQPKRFEANDPAVRALRYAALEAGTLFGTAAAPYGRADLETLLARLVGASLSPEGYAAVAAARALLDTGSAPDGRGFGMGIDMVTAPAWFPRADMEGDSVTAWGWAERPALVSIPIEMSALDSLYARVVLELREDHNIVDFPGATDNPTTWIEDPSYVDWMFPFESFVSAEYGPLSLAMGRDRLRWGPGATGTLVLGDAPDFYDFAQAGITGDWFAYRFLLIGLNPTVLSGEVPYGKLNWNAVEAWEKNLVLHRFEWLVMDRVAVALVEGLMVGGAPLAFAHFNPFLVLHNLWSWNRDPLPTDSLYFLSAASVASIELRVNPLRYMELYGSFAMNQFTTQYEKDRFGVFTIPDAFGYQAGVDAAYPLLGGWLRGRAEYTFTNPWFYIRESRLTSFTSRRYLASNVLHKYSNYADSCIGYPYGPDARVLYLSAGWDAPGRLDFGLYLELAERGEHDFSTPYDDGVDAVALTTPTGTPEETFRVGAEASWRPMAGLELGAGMEWRSTDNAGHVTGARASAVDFMLGATLYLDDFLAGLRGSAR